MTIDADIHTALMAQAEVMVAALDYTALWSKNGGDKPAGEHLTVYHLPNDNTPLGLSDQVMQRQGFLIVTLVSPLGGYEAVTKEKAGQIAAYFKRGLHLTKNTTTVTIVKADVRRGLQQADRWETPIWISYRSAA
jgi:hypothetical protein